MPTATRQQSEGNVYHVFARGTGRQMIFESDRDRLRLLELMKKHLPAEAAVYAWCLMDNHFHLLIRCDLPRLSVYTQRVVSAYAKWFNKKYDRAGHLFQSPFGSQPISSDEQLLNTVAYIHRNPIAAGMAQTCEEYQWSSYREYQQETSGSAKKTFAETAFVLDLAGGWNSFVGIHRMKGVGFSCIDIKDFQSPVHAAEIVLGSDWSQRIANSPRSERNRLLRLLKDAGLSIRQIERLTGIGRGVISRL